MNKEFKKLLEASYTKGFEECTRTGHKVGQLDAIFNSIVMGEFAELIVRECAQLILDKKMGDLGDNPGVKEWEEGYNEAVHDCYYLIRKHFGVEE